MGIQINKSVSTLSEKAFHQLDYKVMALAFDLHNSIGNLWDENDYKTKLLELCIGNGMDSHSEVEISVFHNEFTKAYFIDLLVEGAVYELKTTLKIASSHESQTLNYLFLTNTRHAKIINFRPDLLEWRFTSTSLTQHQRTSYNLMTDNWESDGETCCDVPDLVSDLLNDWGAYLDIQLYKEAVLFFSGAPTDNNTKRFPPLSSERLLHVTGISRKKSIYQKNLQKYLITSIHSQIDWINFDQNQIEIRTLGKK